jgi:glycosyltransferase involved in cell wall biosynthesis
VARAAALLGERRSDGVLLDVAGDGPERAALEALAAAEAPGLVRFHGRLPRAQLQALVREATLSAVPSRWYENQPLAVLESYAVGVPVLATDLGGLPELVDDTTGWVVPANDPDEMGRALAEALLAPAEARARGTRARRRAEERHEPKAHHAAIAAIYEEAGVRA